MSETNANNKKYDLEGERLKKIFLNKRRRKNEPEPADTEINNASAAKYAVTTKKNGLKFAIILLYIAWFLWPFALLATPTGFYGVFVGIAVSLGTFLPLIRPLTWAYTEKDYATAVSEGDFIAAIVYGNVRMKKLALFKINEAVAIAPYDQKYIEHFKVNEVKNIVNVAPDGGSRDKYFFLHEDADKNTTVIIFEAAQKLLRALRYYNSEATVMTATSK